MSPTSSWPAGLSLRSILVAFVVVAFGFIAGASSARAQNSGNDKRSDKPLYVEYKGVRIGMEAAEVRKKLGEPTDKSDVQDFFMFSDSESAQVFYVKGKVNALSVNYVGDKKAPLPALVLGTEIEAKPDGGMHKLVRYPQAGYWVSYNRTGGDDPLITVTMQAIQ
jgi:hypothetical protein